MFLINISINGAENEGLVTKSLIEYHIRRNNPRYFHVAKYYLITAVFHTKHLAYITFKSTKSCIGERSGGIVVYYDYSAGMLFLFYFSLTVIDQTKSNEKNKQYNNILYLTIMTSAYVR